MNIPGTLLIAPPSVNHQLFRTSTVLVTDINGSGTTGLILNRESRMTIAEFGDRLGYDLDHVPSMLHIGGSDRQTSFSILHSPEWDSKNTFRINEYFSVSSDDDVLRKFADGDEPKQWRMFLGMCTWEPGQLDNEVNGIGSPKASINWCTSTCDSELVFDTDLEDIWDTALERCSNEFARNFMI
jgi:putative transcriptional regulator